MASARIEEGEAAIDIVRLFEALSRELSRVLQSMPENDIGCDDYQRLKRAIASADKGAAMARKLSHAAPPKSIVAGSLGRDEVSPQGPAHQISRSSKP